MEHTVGLDFMQARHHRVGSVSRPLLMASVAEVVAEINRGVKNTGPRDVNYQMKMQECDYRDPADGAEPAFCVQKVLRATRHGLINSCYYAHCFSCIYAMSVIRHATQAPYSPPTMTVSTQEPDELTGTWSARYGKRGRL
jgi:hypothetical protein